MFKAEKLSWNLLDQPMLLAETLLRLAIPILLMLLLLRVGVRVMRAAFPHSPVSRRVERYLNWTVWLILGLWVTGFLPLLLDEMEQLSWHMGGAKVTLRAVVEGVLSSIVVLLVTLSVSSAIEKRLMTSMEGAADSGALSLRKMLVNASRAALLLIGLLLAMSMAGIPITALSVFGGALGVGIGLGLQKLAANYVSGYVILAERSLRIGDTVKVDNFEGRITDIKTRYTVIRALSGRESIVPNEVLLTQRVENATLADSRLKIESRVTVDAATDIHALIPKLTQVVSQVPRVIADPAPAVLLNQFLPEGIELQVDFWIADPENGQGNARSEVNLAVLTTLREQNIKMGSDSIFLRREHVAREKGV